MRFQQEGDWFVSTPILIGFPEEVDRASRCPHERWVKKSRSISEGVILVMEGCAACVAQRSRYRPATAADKEQSC